MRQPSQLAIRSILVVSAATLAGCSTTTISLDEGTREYVAEDYETVLKLWTREKELLNVREFDNVLQATATYESWDFRWAYVVRYAEDYRLTIDQRRRLLEAALAETREHHQFYVAVQAKRVRWSDLTSDPAAWIVRLIDDAGSETAPSNIEEIKRPGAIELTYFPYTTPWRKAFRIQFPTVRNDGRPTISANAKWFGLRFAGAQGNDELIWVLEEE